MAPTGIEHLYSEKPGDLIIMVIVVGSKKIWEMLSLEFLKNGHITFGTLTKLIGSMICYQSMG